MMVLYRSQILDIIIHPFGIPIHPIVVGIFQSGLKWWTNPQIHNHPLSHTAFLCLPIKPVSAALLKWYMFSFSLTQNQDTLPTYIGTVGTNCPSV